MPTKINQSSYVSIALMILILGGVGTAAYHLRGINDSMEQVPAVKRELISIHDELELLNKRVESFTSDRWNIHHEATLDEMLEAEIKKYHPEALVPDPYRVKREYESGVKPHK